MQKSPNQLPLRKVGFKTAHPAALNREVTSKAAQAQTKAGPTKVKKRNSPTQTLISKSSLTSTKG